MFSRICFVLCLLTGIYSQNSAIVENCNANSVFLIKEVNIQPVVPIIGTNITITTMFESLIEVNDGYAKYECNLNGLPYNTLDSLCTQTTCPIILGTHTEYSVMACPDITGKLLCYIRWTNTESTEEYLCIKFILKINGSLRKNNFNGTNLKWFRNYSEPLAHNALVIYYR
jgi:hypothetical protein